jgi:hypothetical protein
MHIILTEQMYSGPKQICLVKGFLLGKLTHGFQKILIVEEECGSINPGLVKSTKKIVFYRRKPFQFL